MTREEAIKGLKSLVKVRRKYGDMQTMKDEIECLDMAIKALEQEPTEFEEIDFVQEHKKIPVTLDLTPCYDAISRQAALDALESIGSLDTEADKKYARSVFEALPPVTPQPKTGHWIPVSERLPVLRGRSKISDDVLITNGFENDMGYLVERKGKIFWHYYGGEYEVCIKDEDNDATAWMPLPEPYRVESEDKWNPVNPYLRSIKKGEGKETLITMDGEIIKGVFTSMDDGADGVGYISHFATCSHAEEFRKAGK